MTKEEITDIIRLLRNADRPVEFGPLADDAAKALEKLQADVAHWKGSAESTLAKWQETLKLLAEEQEYAALWRAFEEMETVSDDLIERTNQEIISDTEGNADLDGCAVSGDWERIFGAFLYVTKKRLLKWPERKKP